MAANENADRKNDSNDNEAEGSSTCGRLHFIEQIVEQDLRSNKYNGRVHTRFPPDNQQRHRMSL